MTAVVRDDAAATGGEAQPLVTADAEGTTTIEEDQEALEELARAAALKDHMKPDERAMTVGLVNIMLTAFTVGRWPQHFFILHLLKMTILLPWRYIRFRRHRWEFYLVEFCYFVSYATLIGCFLALLRTTYGYTSPLAEYNGLLFRVGFSFASGPLCWSIFIFRNSIVLHDIDQLTSTFIHLSPPLLFWCWRWGGGVGPSIVHRSWPGMLEICANPAELDPDWRTNETAQASLVATFDGSDGADACTTALWCDMCTASVYELVLLPQVVYVVCWAVPYYLLLFCLAAGYIERNKCDTLYKYTLSSNPVVKSIVTRAPECLQPVVYILIHQTSTLVFGSLSLIWWHSFPLHTLFIASMIFLSCSNGASYTFRVFLKRYEGQLLARHPSIQDATRSR